MNKGPENKPLLWLILLMIIVHSFHYEFYAAKIAFKIQRKEYSCQKIEPFFSFTENNDLFNPSPEILNICKNKIKGRKQTFKIYKIWLDRTTINPSKLCNFVRKDVIRGVYKHPGRERKK